ncbi:MAG: YDG domain-containing protein [Christensenellaceae bacterium]|jgi:hypothetical protein|nr:YDG domain-containing protein [Christensenellaceae bacterium]
MKNTLESNRKKRRNAFTLASVFSVFLIIICAIVSFATTNTTSVANAYVETEYTDYTIAYAPNSYGGPSTDWYVTNMLPANKITSQFYHTNDSGNNVVPSGDDVKYQKLYGTTSGVPFSYGSASNSYIILDLGAPKPFSRITMAPRSDGFAFDYIRGFTVYTTSNESYNDQTPPKEFYLNLRSNGYFQKRQAYTFDDHRVVMRDVYLDNTVVTRYVAITLDKGGFRNDTDREVFCISSLHLYGVSVSKNTATLSNTTYYYDDYDIIYAPMCNVVAQAENVYGSINTIRPGVDSPTNFHPGDSTNNYNGIKATLYESNNRNLDFVVLDLKNIKEISSVIMRLRQDGTDSHISGFNVRITSRTEDPSSLGETFFKTISNFTICATLSGVSDVNGSPTNDPLFLSFTPVMTRYVLIEVPDGWNKHSSKMLGFISELRIANGYSEKTKNVQLVPSDNIASKSYIFYGNAGNHTEYASENYTVAYAPNSVNWTSGDSNSNYLNNGTDGINWFHSYYNVNHDPVNYSTYGRRDGYNSLAYFYFVIDLKTPRIVNGLSYYPRLGDGNQNGRILTFDIYIDRGNLYDTYASDPRLIELDGNPPAQTTHFVKVGSGSWAGNQETKLFLFPNDNAYITRYVVLKATSTQGATSAENNQYLTCRELTISGLPTEISGSTPIYSQQDLWDNVSSSGRKEGSFYLANDILVDNAPGYTYGSSGGNLMQTAGTRATRVSYANHAYNDPAAGLGGGNNIFSGNLYGGGHTVTYNLATDNGGDTLKWDDGGTKVGNPGGIEDWKVEPYTYNALITANLYGGLIKDLNIVVASAINLSAACGSNRVFHDYFGVVAGIASGIKGGRISEINNVHVKIEKNIILRGYVAAVSDQTITSGATGMTLGGMVGVVRQAGVTIKNSVVEMAENVSFVATGQARMLESSQYRLSDSNGRARVGGFIGEIFAVDAPGTHEQQDIFIIDCELNAPSSVVMYAASYIVGYKTSTGVQTTGPFNDAAVGGIVGSMQVSTVIGGNKDDNPSVPVFLVVNGFILNFSGALIISDFETPHLYNYGYNGANVLGVCAAGLLIGAKGAGVGLHNWENNTVYVATNMATKIMTRPLTGTGSIDFNTLTRDNIINGNNNKASDVATLNASMTLDNDTNDYTHPLTTHPTSSRTIEWRDGNIWFGKADGFDTMGTQSRVDINVKYGVYDTNMPAGTVSRFTGIHDGKVSVNYKTTDSDKIFAAYQIGTSGTINYLYDQKLSNLDLLFNKAGTIPIVYAMYYTTSSLDIKAGSPQVSSSPLTSLTNLPKNDLSKTYTKYYDALGVTYEFKISSTINGVSPTNYTDTLKLSAALKVEELYKPQGDWVTTNTTTPVFSYVTQNKDVLPSSGAAITYYGFRITDKNPVFASDSTYGRMVMLDVLTNYDTTQQLAVPTAIPRYGAWQDGQYFVSFKILPREFDITSGTKIIEKTYDASTALPTLTGGLNGTTDKHYTYNGVNNEITVIVNSGNYDTKHVGTSKNVTIKFNITGNTSNGYKASNYISKSTQITMPTTTTTTTTTGGITFNGRGTITVKIFTVTKGALYSKTYDKLLTAAITPTSGAYILSSICTGDEIKQISANFASLNVGKDINIKVTFSITDGNLGKNYQISASGTGVTGVGGSSNLIGNDFYFVIKGNITERALQINKTTNTFTKTYNRTNDTTIADNSIYYTYSNLVNIDSNNKDTISQSSAKFNDINAGDVYITITININDGNGGKNYKLEQGTVYAIGSETGNPYTFQILGKINPETLKISSTTTKYSRIYDGSTTANITSTHYEVSGIISPDTISSPITPTFDNKNAGPDKKVTFYLSIEDGRSSNKGGNYKFEKSGSYLFSADGSKNNFTIVILADITKATILVTPVTPSAQNNQNRKEYGGVDPTFTYDTTFPASPNVTFTLTGALTRDPGENVGDYEIKKGSLGVPNTAPDYHANNYQINFVEGIKFQIYKKILTLKLISAYTKFYDAGNTVNLSELNDNQSTYFTLANRVGSDAVTVKVTAASFNSTDANASISITITLEIVSSTSSNTSSNNYTLSLSYSISGKINPLPITISKNGNNSFSKTYDGYNTYTPTIVSSNYNILGNGQPLIEAIKVQITGVNITSQTFDSKNVGNRTLTVTFGTLLTTSTYITSNYQYTPSSTLTYSGSITKKEVTFTLTWNYTNNSLVYNGNLQTVIVTNPYFTTGVPSVSSSERIDVSFTYKNNSYTDAGTYKAEATPTYSSIANSGDVNNYTITTSNTSLNWTIYKAQLTISGDTVNKVSKTYDSKTTATFGGFKLSGIANGEDIGISGTSTNYNNKNAGDGKNIIIDGLSITGDTASNYAYVAGNNASILGQTLTLYGVGEILKKDFSIDFTWDYKGAFTYDASDKEVKVESKFSIISTGVASETLNFSYTYSNNIKTDAGTYTATLSIYTISNGSGSIDNYNEEPTLKNTSLPWEIKKADLTVTTRNYISKTYDSKTDVKDNIFSDAYLLNTVFSKDEVYINGTANYNNKNVGTKDIIVSNVVLAGKGYLNYTLVAGANTTYQNNTLTLKGMGRITAFGLTITGISASDRQYNAQTTITLTGTPVLNEVFSGDQVTVSLGYGTVENKNVGNSKAVTTNIQLSGTDSSNYSLTQPTFNVNITPKAITASGIEATTRAYNASLEVSISISNALLDGVENVDSSSVSLSGSTGKIETKNAGNNKVVTPLVSLTGTEASNYTISSTNPILVNITKKEVTLTWSQSSFTFDGTNKTVTANFASTSVPIGGISQGIHVNDIVTIQYSNNVNRNADYYTASATLIGDDGGNYSLDLTGSVEYTILPHTVNVNNLTWSLDDETYNFASILFDGTTHTIKLQSHNDSLVTSLGVKITVNFFGLCSCGIDTSLTYHSDHQLSLSQTGPMHAGTYWMLVSFDETDEDAKNLAFSSQGSGYNPTNYFSSQTSAVSLYSVQNNLVEDNLPILQSKFTSLYSHSVFKFSVLQSVLGFQAGSTSDVSTTYNSLYHCVDKPVPNQDVQSEVIVVLLYELIYDDDQDKYILPETSTQYTYDNYATTQDGILIGGVKGAGKYLIVFVVDTASQTDSIDCDYASGSVPSINIQLTILKKEIKVSPKTILNNKVTKVYNGNSVSYSDYNGPDLTIASSSNAADGKIIEGTDVSISSAEFNSPFVSTATKVSFTLDGDDKDNYFILDLAAAITAKEISVIFNSADTYTYNGSERNYTPSVDGILSEDLNTNINVVYSGNKSTSVGVYTSKVSITGERTSNYTLSYPSEKLWYINKKAVTLNLQEDLSHVYDGMTTIEYLNATKKVSESLFITSNSKSAVYSRDTITTTLAVIKKETEDNPEYAIEVGEHTLIILQAPTSTDENGISNYEFSIGASKDYKITKRSITITYSNIMQSLNDVDNDYSRLEDVSITYIGNDSKNGPSRTGFNFSQLIKIDGLASYTYIENEEEITIPGLGVDNTLWRVDYQSKDNPPYYSYSPKLLNVPQALDKNYTYKKPRLIIIGFEIVPERSDSFYINDLEDLLSMHYLIDGLAEDEIIPIIYQTADIDGIVDFERSVYIPAVLFKGIYYGGNHTISNLLINGTGLFESISGGTVLSSDGTLIGGIVENLKLRDITIFASTSTSNSSTKDSVGAISGKIENTIIRNISFEGYIYVENDISSVYVGGISGYAVDSSILNCEVVGYILVDSTYSGEISDFAVGSVVGYFSADQLSSLTFSARSFVDIRIFTKLSNTNINSQGAIGVLVENDNTISQEGVNLKNSISINGKILTTAGKTYTELVSEDSALIDILLSFIVKPYYLADLVKVAGTSENPYKISNYIQLVLLKIYSWASFELENDIIFPPHALNFESSDVYYGENYITNNYEILSSDVSATTTLFIDSENMPIIIVKKRALKG